MVLVNEVFVPNMIDQTSKVLEKNTFHYFLIYMHRAINLTYTEKGQRTTLDHHLNKFWRPRVLDALYQVSRFPVSRFWKRRF